MNIDHHPCEALLLDYASEAMRVERSTATHLHFVLLAVRWSEIWNPLVPP